MGDFYGQSASIDADVGVSESLFFGRASDGRTTVSLGVGVGVGEGVTSMVGHTVTRPIGTPFHVTPLQTLVILHDPGMALAQVLNGNR